ncbi:antichymotrypsin-2-like [Sitodiplosis mosellana]|uniref:antichymotrypsin-2-like n=1 Tax=Sitodiplosis mosellana TaxID=263140 RepID=UPI002443D2CA|nr:antichymotrypsin-2-like [Sitodiplosis mosellana]
MKKFGAGIEHVDFDKPHETAQTINQFVKENTMGKIPSAVTPDSFGDETSVFLVNAISFKAKWCNRFRSFLTKSGEFHISKTDTAQVQFMENRSYFNYAVLDELNATALQMDYEESYLSFVVILLNTRVGLYELESRLKNYDLSKVTDQMTYKLVDVKLPRFKYECKMGMNEMFKRDDANLWGMLDPLIIGPPLFISNVIHKAVIEIDEDGTVAAAITGF